ncbi:MAG TPA: Gfo/Idh/MocA family oxidoreductase [Candidatus Hydrogenedentes bacterium]|nr:Gfo/Idh/MocA family oxidoreductase [Candidatus Hydrogenedentota bacterium]HQM51203.1 Gfo/Idh/MocA family oxidoreductase [Candidatus Hydrogenedentota bacterium]
MSLRIAFVGFRHAHVYGLYDLARNHKDLQIVAACEEHAETRAQLAGLGIAITHDTYDAMLDETPCDIVACADYFSIHGERVFRALERGKHVLCDKPLCVQLDELNRIESLAREKGRRVGCMLDLVDGAPFVTLREIIRRGDIGEVLSINILGQHPLKYGSRPMWFFEEGKHCGTINDIGIHVIDAVPWLTGYPIEEITAAHGWNGRIKQHPHFEDGAMLMLKLANGCGVMADISYFSPDAAGYSMPTYWRFTVAGAKGTVEVGHNLDKALLWPDDEGGARELALLAPRTGGYLDDFLADIAGKPAPGGLDMARVFRSARIGLLAQRAATTGPIHLKVIP